MNNKVNYTLVGVFVFSFVIGLFGFGIWLGKYGLQESYHVYRLEMKESIAGLSKDSTVKLRGVDIGRVSVIRINPKNIEKIEILLNIKKEIPIKVDMYASTKMLGVTGLLSIEIDGGSNGAKTLLPTLTHIPLIPSRTSLLTTLSSNLETLSEDLKDILKQTQKLFSNQNIETFSRLLSHAEVLEKRAMVLMDETNTTLFAFSRDFHAIKEVSVPTITKIMQTSKNFNRLTYKIERTFDRGDYNLKKILDPLLVDVQIISSQLSTMTRELSDNPSSILFKSRKSRKGPGE
jgi:phospholipid/cholesterol/gamma-HCH transport system substrate-binding protein